MHQTDLPQRAIDGVMRRRGHLHYFDTIDPAKTALVVIDMQNVFLQEGAPAEVPVAREIVPNINRLAGALRDAGGTVAWVQMTHTEEDLESWSFFYEAVSSPERAARLHEWLAEGSEGHKLWPDLDVRDEDWIHFKNRYSAFLPGSSDIAERLSGAGIDTVLITGTLTNVCCESSARDAMMRNFKTMLLSDANAAPTDADHLAALATIFQVFGDVQSTDEVIALLETASRAPGQAAAE